MKKIEILMSFIAILCLSGCNEMRLCDVQLCDVQYEDIYMTNSNVLSHGEYEIECTTSPYYPCGHLVLVNGNEAWRGKTVAMRTKESYVFDCYGSADNPWNDLVVQIWHVTEDTYVAVYNGPIRNNKETFLWCFLKIRDNCENRCHLSTYSCGFVNDCCEYSYGDDLQKIKNFFWSLYEEKNREV